MKRVVDMLNEENREIRFKWREEGRRLYTIKLEISKAQLAAAVVGARFNVGPAPTPSLITYFKLVVEVVATVLSMPMSR